MIENPDELLDLPVPERAREAGKRAAEAQDLATEYARLRGEAIQEMSNAGMTKTQIGEVIGLSRQRVGQILGGGVRPERALIARGSATIAVGGKIEAHREGDGTAPRAVASTEALSAASAIQALCRQNKLDATIEVVQPPGMVDLNRPNLVVIGSPRVLPVMTQVLPADRRLGFADGPRGWHLTINGSPAPSPCDTTGDPVDYAYIGRLPNPAGGGSFLYVAGVHAMGTLGAAQYLTDNADALYGLVKLRRWSMAVAVEYDPDMRTVTNIAELAPVKVL